MKRILCFFICISLLIACTGCGGSHKNQMTKEKWTNLGNYAEWFDCIYTQTDYAKNIQVFNFIEKDKELILYFDGSDRDIETYFKFLIDASNTFFQNNKHYFTDIDRMQIVYEPAGCPAPIIISTYPESRLEELNLDTGNNDHLELQYLSIDGDFIKLNTNQKQKYNCKLIYLQDVIEKDNETDTYDLSALDLFNHPQTIVLYSSSSEYDSNIKKEIQKKLPDVQVIFR